MQPIYRMLAILFLLVLATITPAVAGNCQYPKADWQDTPEGLYKKANANWWYWNDGSGTKPMSPACQAHSGTSGGGANCRNNFVCAVMGETDCVPSGIKSWGAGRWNSCSGGAWNKCTAPAGDPPKCISPENAVAGYTTSWACTDFDPNNQYRCLTPTP